MCACTRCPVPLPFTSFNEDLNTLEVFAYAHVLREYKVEKLSGQLLLDVASRLQVCLSGGTLITLHK